METIKDYVISVFKKDGVQDFFIRQVIKMSEERIQWIKDVAWNLARRTGKFDILAISKELSSVERMILYLFLAEETNKVTDEEKIEHEKFMRNIRQHNIEKASSSMIYLFPIGEA